MRYNAGDSLHSVGRLTEEKQQNAEVTKNGKESYHYWSSREKKERGKVTRV